MVDFVWKVEKSFGEVKKDVENLRANVNDWIVFLENKNNKIEERLDKIEDRMDRLEEAMFQILSYR